jgi:hypothetical protein
LAVLPATNSEALRRSLTERLAAVVSRAENEEVAAVWVPDSKVEGKAFAVRTFIFSGHMVDAPDRRKPRFPAEAVAAVGRAIGRALDQGSASKGDIAICSGAAGGDLLFLEAALARGLRATVCLPFSETEFLETSVREAGPDWQERYFRLTRMASVDLRVLPLEESEDSDAYGRCNTWMLYQGLASGSREVSGIVVWDGKPGDGEGGASHMVEGLRKWGVPVAVIDPLNLAG